MWQGKCGNTDTSRVTCGCAPNSFREMKNYTKELIFSPRFHSIAFLFFFVISRQGNKLPAVRRRME